MIDLLSAADLAAGAVEHYLTRNDRMGDSLTIKEESNKILAWLGRDGLGLKKQTILIRKEDLDFRGADVLFTSKGDETGEVISIGI